MIYGAINRLKFGFLLENYIAKNCKSLESPKKGTFQQLSYYTCPPRVCQDSIKKKVSRELGTGNRTGEHLFPRNRGQKARRSPQALFLTAHCSLLSVPACQWGGNRFLRVFV